MESKVSAYVMLGLGSKEQVKLLSAMDIYEERYLSQGRFERFVLLHIILGLSATKLGSKIYHVTTPKRWGRYISIR